MMTNADLTIYNSHGVDKKTARKIYLIRSASLYLQIRKGKNTLILISIGNYLPKKQKSIGRSITGICLEKDC